MEARKVHALDQRLRSFLERLTSSMNRPEQRRWAGYYLRGLLLDGQRKSIAPLAQRVGADVQCLQQFIGQSTWSARQVQRTLNQWLQRQLGSGGYWIIDETSFPKQGNHSVGVARQYCGSLGKKANCQVAVSLHARQGTTGWPLGWRLYLPESWTEDPERRRQAGIPPEVGFQTKTDLALGLVAQARAEGLEPGMVLADQAYGSGFAWREQLRQWKQPYCVAVNEDISVWSEEVWQTQRHGCHRGRPRRSPPREASLPLAQLARQLPAKTWRRVTWREGSRGPQRSRFARVAVRASHRKGGNARLEHWREYALIEWPEAAPSPTRFWLSWWADRQPRWQELVAAAKGRWPIEQDYRELKEELGLDHFEGRSWAGWEHHVAMVTLAFAFLRLEKRHSKKKPQGHVAAAAMPVDSPADSFGGLLPVVPDPLPRFLLKLT
jgi:SRSO17 transposase